MPPIKSKPLAKDEKLSGIVCGDNLSCKSGIVTILQAQASPITTWSKGGPTVQINIDDAGIIHLMIGDDTVALVRDHKLYVEASKSADGVLTKLLEILAK